MDFDEQRRLAGTFYLNASAWPTEDNHHGKRAHAV
jgi:hypothetical protein